MKVPTSKLKANPSNPRILRDEKFRKLKASIESFPDMLNKRPIVAVTDTDGKYMVLGGNMRLRACQDLKLKEVPIILADEWTEEQRREFIIKDNVGYGEWDWDQLANEWKAEDLDAWGLDVPKSFDAEPEENDDYTPGFKLVIECTSEQQQRQYYDEITKLGIECKPLTL
jgi:ParB-like chromosome segregation protein Spo0J